MSTPEEPTDHPEQVDAGGAEPKPSRTRRRSVFGPDDVDSIDHPTDRVGIDGDDSAIPGEWL